MLASDGVCLFWPSKSEPHCNPTHKCHSCCVTGFLLGWTCHMPYHAFRTPATLTPQPVNGANMLSLASHCSSAFILPRTTGLLVCSHHQSLLLAICMPLPFHMVSRCFVIHLHGPVPLLASDTAASCPWHYPSPYGTTSVMPNHFLLVLGAFTF